MPKQAGCSWWAVLVVATLLATPDNTGRGGAAAAAEQCDAGSIYKECSDSGTVMAETKEGCCQACTDAGLGYTCW